MHEIDHPVDQDFRLVAVGGVAAGVELEQLDLAGGQVRGDALDLGEARGFVFDAMLVIIERVLQSLSGTSMRDACYRVPGLAPAWLERYRDHLEGTVHFVRGDVLRLQFPAELLARSCLTADARSHARAAAECARLLEAHQQRRRVGERVRMLLADSADRLPGAEEIAAQLHLSTRSLFRRLADEGHSLRALGDELRSERARFWLRDTDRAHRRTPRLRRCQQLRALLQALDRRDARSLSPRSSGIRPS